MVVEVFLYHYSKSIGKYIVLYTALLSKSTVSALLLNITDTVFIQVGQFTRGINERLEGAKYYNKFISLPSFCVL